MKKRSIAICLTLALALTQPLSAGIIEYDTPTGAQSPKDGPVAAKAFFTIGNGSITVTLTDLLANPTSAGQLISGISFDISGSTGTGALTTTSDPGNLVSTLSTQTSGHPKVTTTSYTAGVADPLTRWHSSESGATVTLTTLNGGGNPDRLIIGPDDLGKLDPTLGGHYSAANASIYGDNPNVLGSATFTITIPGVTTSSVLSNVKILFGTTGAPITALLHHVPDGSGGTKQSTVPEPSSLALLGLGALSMAIGAYRRRQSPAK